MDLNQLSEQELFAESQKLLEESTTAVSNLFNEDEARIQQLDLTDILAFLEEELYDLYYSFTDFDNSDLFLECNEVDVETKLENLYYLEEKFLDFDFTPFSEKIILLAEQVKPSLSKLNLILTEYSERTGLV